MTQRKDFEELASVVQDLAELLYDITSHGSILTGRHKRTAEEILDRVNKLQQRENA